MTEPDQQPGDRIKVRRHWKSQNNDIIRCCAEVNGRITFGELVRYFARSVPRINFLHDVELNFATATWDDQATPEELDRRAAQNAAHDRRHKEWERKTYQRLKAKFEGIKEDR